MRIAGYRTPQVQLVKDGVVVAPYVNCAGMKTFTVQVAQRDGTDVFQIDGSIDGVTFPLALLTTGVDGVPTAFTANVSRLKITKTSGSGVATDVTLQMSPI